ncbi:hypothetical protein QFC22_004183 [Naganishia vaughanmartiniae]|uniref:Uncharacterized protein n=1 Tax=Naganishia vaughanmartiniae TaxID=1424756 RepID=A0ACC2X4Q2_9TREE|nr:hypothetical protein QFC22_004183 [Naganishia vaughanmartiniae]
MDSKNSNDPTSIRRFATLESHLDLALKVETEKNSTTAGNLPEIDDSAESQLPTTSKLILLAACLTFSNIVSSLLSGSVTVILDDLAADLHIEEHNLQWAFNSAQLPFGCFILIAGKAADIGGRKRTFVIGSVLSSIMNLVAGFMRNEMGFYVCRALGGLAGSLVAASNMVAKSSKPTGELVDKRIDWLGGFMFTSGSVQGTWFFLIGSLCTAIANVLYATMDEAASYWKFEAWGQALCVVGPDLVASMGYIYITGVVDLAEVAVAVSWGRIVEVHSIKRKRKTTATL